MKDTHLTGSSCEVLSRCQYVAFGFGRKIRWADESEKVTNVGFYLVVGAVDSGVHNKNSFKGF